jgi:hypothetical protein
MTTQEQKVFHWQDGLPTGPDVALLQKKYPELKPGDRMSYAEVSELLGVAYPSARFVSVTQVWRKRELEKNVVILCEKGEGFFVATPEQVCGETYGVLQSIGRKARMQRTRLAVSRTENTSTSQMIVHQSRLMAEIEREAKAKRMNILPPAAASAPPRPMIGAQA